jgi:hypothetical protein
MLFTLTCLFLNDCMYVSQCFRRVNYSLLVLVTQNWWIRLDYSELDTGEYEFCAAWEAMLCKF